MHLEIIIFLDCLFLVITMLTNEIVYKLKPWCFYKIAYSFTILLYLSYFNLWKYLSIRRHYKL